MSVASSAEMFGSKSFMAVTSPEAVAEDREKYAYAYARPAGTAAQDPATAGPSKVSKIADRKAVLKGGRRVVSRASAGGSGARGITGKYKQFCMHLQGYVHVEFAKFRELLVLKDEEPAEGERRFVYQDARRSGADLIEAGGGAALRMLIGERRFAAAFPGASDAPNPMSKAELDAAMIKMVRSSLRAGWAEKDFEDYQRLLDAGGELGLAPEATQWALAMTGEFTRNYVAGTKVYRALVQDHLAQGAAEARKLRERREQDSADQMERAVEAMKKKLIAEAAARGAREGAGAVQAP